MVPPPLIDPDVDIANDPAYAIRLLDILDQISLSSGGSGGGVTDSSLQLAGVSCRRAGMAAAAVLNTAGVPSCPVI